MDFISCALRNFNCNEYNREIVLKDGDEYLFHISYKEEVLKYIANTYLYMFSYGMDSVRYLENDFIALQVNESIKDPIKRNILVNNIYVKSQALSNALWFIKDNSITPGLAVISSDVQISPCCLRRSVYYTTAKGEFKIVNYSLKEIEIAMEWYKIINKFLFNKPSKEIDISNNLTNMSNYISFNIPSFNRAYYYLDTARNTDFLPAKIASYISILETIFAANGENTQKVAERTAYFIGESIHERISIYDDVKSIYDIRSCYVHGSLISDKKHQTIPEISEKADSIARRVLKKAYKEYPQLNYMNKKDKNNPNSMNNIEVDRWFNELILRKE